MTIESDARKFAAAVEHDMQVWMERAVIGLNLCPFAKAVHVRGQIHYAVSRARTSDQLAMDLAQQLRDLVALDPTVRDTTLLIAPDWLPEFLAFNDFLAHADRILHHLALEGTVQIASFHPDYQFADAPVDDISNYTNRAPYPTLHLLREASIDRAVQAFPDAESIFGRNLQTMQALGAAGWQALGIHRTAPAPDAPAPAPAPVLHNKTDP